MPPFALFQGEIFASKTGIPVRGVNIERSLYPNTLQTLDGHIQER